jgi:hypothetical protein
LLPASRTCSSKRSNARRRTARQFECRATASNVHELRSKEMGIPAEMHRSRTKVPLPGADSGQECAGAMLCGLLLLNANEAIYR